jgi:serine/threonine protein phosphatase PrpC
MALTFIPANAQHIGSRQEQQDSFTFSDPEDRQFVSHGGLLAVVADGMGGLADGALASRAAVQAFHSAYRAKPRAETIQSALRRSLAEANLAVGLSVGAVEPASAGTTIAAAVLYGSCLYWIAVGDTRIYVLRSGRLARVNVDHNYRTKLWPEIAEGRVARESAWNDPKASHLTSYVGMRETPPADASDRPFPLMPDDVVVVCTDGVYRALSENEIAAAFLHLPIDAACESVRNHTLSKGHSQQDNLTVISVQCRSAVGGAGEKWWRPKEDTHNCRSVHRDSARGWVGSTADISLNRSFQPHHAQDFA